MQIPIRRIGNSKGIILPAALISACGIRSEVDLRLEGRSIIIEPTGMPRSSWFESYVAEKDLDAWNTVPQDEETDEWEW